MDYSKFIKFYPDFPIKGVNFVDIIPFLQDKALFQSLCDDLTAMCEAPNVAAPEARGFLFGDGMLYGQNPIQNLIPLRKKGKLPRETVSVEYELEYGTATLEIHKDAIQPGQKVLLVDDLIATGGTNLAMAHLIESLGGEIAGVVVLMELAGLKGREKLGKYPLYSALTYEGK